MSSNQWILKAAFFSVENHPKLETLGLILMAFIAPILGAILFFVFNLQEAALITFGSLEGIGFFFLLVGFGDPMANIGGL